MTDCDDLTTEEDPTYLTRKATKLMEKVVDGVTLAIELPAALIPAPKSTSEPATKKAKTGTKSGTTTTASARQPKRSQPTLVNRTLMLTHTQPG